MRGVYRRDVNEEHLEICSSTWWREALTQWIIPYAMEGTSLGDDVLEIGPGPGLVTDELREIVAKLTVIELDPRLAAGLRARLADTNVDVVEGDASAMPFDDARFSGAASFTMLHHVPTVMLQDKVLSEVARVLRPGATFVMSDSVASDELAALHDNDIYNPIAPDSMEPRLLAAGFATCDVKWNEFGWAAVARR